MTAELKKIADEVLFGEEHPGKMREACIKLYELLIETSDLNNLDGISDNMILPSGKAISPIGAAHCVLDFMRTTKFMRGLFRAIEEAQIRFPNEQIEVLYAGCGPFATLVLPLCAVLDPEVARFTLLDFHKVSIDSARNLFRRFELEGFVSEFVEADASVYKPDHAFHIIISETMQKSLDGEPQAAITQNLAPFLFEKGFLIPEKITVDLCMTDRSKEFTEERFRIKLATLVEVTRSTKPYPKITVEIPAGDHSVLLATHVTVYDSLELGEYNSGITMPTFIPELRNPDSNTTIEIGYELGSRPRLVYEKISAAA